MAGNKNLNKAAKAKFDEFYTRLEDIENECGHYTEFFRDKTIFCNCDDPFESMFFKYFAKNFNAFGLKKLISSSYAGSLIVMTELNLEGTPNEIKNFDRENDAIKSEITEFKDFNGDGREDLYDVEHILKNNKNSIKKLFGNDEYAAGDFRSPECIKFLEEADIVVTNPPFSLFREYVKQLVDYDKKFLIIGNLNAITYKEIFPLIMDNKIWLGYGFNKSPRLMLPDYYQSNESIKIDENGKKYQVFGNLNWFTNLDVKKRHEIIPLGFSYKDEPEKYPKYDNFDAIEVSRTAYIPKDYDGIMGVPVSFVEQYNPEQFEIVGNAGSYGVDGYSLCPALYINGRKIFKRILIRRR